MEKLPERGTYEKKTEELKRTLSTIAEHVSSLIKDAENRAKDGDSPNPTARGGLGTFSTTGTPKSGTVAPTTGSARRSPLPTAPLPPPPPPPTPPPPLTSTSKTATSISAADPDEVESSKYGDDLVVVKPQTFAAATDGGGSGRDREGMPRLDVLSTAKPTAVSAVPGAGDGSEKGSPVEVPARTRVLRRASSVRALFLGVENRGERLETFSLQMGLPHETVVAHVQVRSSAGEQTSVLLLFCFSAAARRARSRVVFCSRLTCFFGSLQNLFFCIGTAATCSFRRSFQLFTTCQGMLCNPHGIQFSLYFRPLVE